MILNLRLKSMAACLLLAAGLPLGQCQEVKAPFAPECISGDFFNLELDRNCACNGASACLNTKKFDSLLNNRKLTKSGRELGVGLFKGLSRIASGKERDFTDTLEGIQNPAWHRDVEKVLTKVKQGDEELDKLLKEKLDGDWDTAQKRIEFIRDFKAGSDLIDGEKGFHFQLIIHASVAETFTNLRLLPMVEGWSIKAQQYEDSKKTKVAEPTPTP